MLHKQWQRKAESYKSQLGAGSVRHKLEKLAEIRRAEGYVTEWFPVESTANFVFTEYNCAIAHIVKTFPNVCGHELEMFAVALKHSRVERTHWMVDGEHCCGYLIEDISV